MSRTPLGVTASASGAQADVDAATDGVGGSHACASDPDEPTAAIAAGAGRSRPARGVASPTLGGMAGPPGAPSQSSSAGGPPGVDWTGLSSPFLLRWVTLRGLVREAVGGAAEHEVRVCP